MVLWVQIPEVIRQNFCGDIVFRTAGHLSQNCELNRSDHTNSCAQESQKAKINE